MKYYEEYKYFTGGLQPYYSDVENGPVALQLLQEIKQYIK